MFTCVANSAGFILNILYFSWVKVGKKVEVLYFWAIKPDLTQWADLPENMKSRLDDKNKLRLPALLRQLGEEVKLGLVINRALTNVSCCTHRSSGEKISDEVNQLNLLCYSKQGSSWVFFRGATPLGGCIIAHSDAYRTLMEYAGIRQDVIIYAYGDQIEIWAKGPMGEWWMVHQRFCHFGWKIPGT